MWHSFLALTLLLAAPSPSGRFVAERRLVDDAWRGRIVTADGALVADLGPSIFPLGWTDGLDRLRVARLVDDGHDVVDAAVGTVTPGGSAAVTWVDGPPDAAVAAWRLRYVTDAAGAVPGSTTAGAVAAPLVVAVDPGHGGPGAGTWNGNNGDGAGARGPNGLTEQWVNLRVAQLLLADLARDPRFAGSFAVRTTATQQVSLADRVALAAQGGADFYLSIHHNGLPAGATNRTETYMCDLNAACGPADCRDMAWDLHDRIVDAFGYTGRGAFEDLAGSGRFHFYVLRYAAMPAVLTEASNLNDAAEEALFGNDPLEGHARAEAVALHLGLVDAFFGTTGVAEPPAPPSPAVRLGVPRAAPGGGHHVTVRFAAPGPFDAVLVDAAGRRVAALGTLHGPATLRLATGGRRPAPCWLVIRKEGTIEASCPIPAG